MVVTTTTTVTMIVASSPFAVSLGIAMIVVLLALLIQKELVMESPQTAANRLGKVLNVAIVPLLLAFVFTIAMKIISMVIK